jgi:MFS family permease
MSDLQVRTMRKVAVRLIPVLLVLYVIAYLDRVNVTFAQDKLESELGFSGAVYGFGAGVFFIGYFFFEVPSNLALHRFGARKWMARIMFTWGLISACMALVQGPVSFYIVRFLLGVAEAGFFPGMILYLSYWFPSRERAKAVAFFMSAIAISYAIGAPISGGIMAAFDGVAGLAAWQWLFIIEAIPALFAAAFVLFYLDDTPEDADWLDPDEKRWLAGRMLDEEKVRLAHERHTVMESLKDRRVLAFGLLYFTMVVNVYGPVVLGRRDRRQGRRPERGRQGLRHRDPVRGGDHRPGRHLALLRSNGQAQAGRGRLDAARAAAFALSTSSRRWRRSRAWPSGLFFLLGTHPVFWAMPAAFLSGAAGGRALP